MSPNASLLGGPCTINQRHENVHHLPPHPKHIAPLNHTASLPREYESSGDFAPLAGKAG